MSSRNDATGTLLGLPPSELAAKFFESRPAPPTREGLIGTELAGRYHVEGIIGHGGMATVYRGIHLTIRKPVAIKVLDPALHVPDAVERFLQEAQATSLVRHENVVEITDFGTTESGVVFVVMELLDGETLHTMLEREGSISVERAVTIIKQICSGLHAAHAAGVIHRDLKPENCFRVPRTSSPDFVKVLDFGIAKVNEAAKTSVTAAPRRTQVGMVVGTPEYMAPEQARAEACDARADVYAAGVMLFQLLSGRLPFNKATAAEVLAQQMYELPPPLFEVQPGLPRGVYGVVDRALAKDPDDRFDTMAAMAAALDAALEDDASASSSDVILAEPAPRPVTRRSHLAMLGGAAVALGVLAAVGISADVASTATPVTNGLMIPRVVEVPPVELGSEMAPMPEPEPEPELELELEPDQAPPVAERQPAANENRPPPTSPEPEPLVTEPKPEPMPRRRAKDEPKSKAENPGSAAKVEPAAKLPKTQPSPETDKISEVKNPFE